MYEDSKNDFEKNKKQYGKKSFEEEDTTDTMDETEEFVAKENVKCLHRSRREMAEKLQKEKSESRKFGEGKNITKRFNKNYDFYEED